jgi:hypothetical protein
MFQKHNNFILLLHPRHKFLDLIKATIFEWGGRRLMITKNLLGCDPETVTFFPVMKHISAISIFISTCSTLLSILTGCHARDFPTTFLYTCYVSSWLSQTVSHVNIFGQKNEAWVVGYWHAFPLASTSLTTLITSNFFFREWRTTTENWTGFTDGISQK